MTETDLQVLKASVDRVVKIICRDGEIMLARIDYVWDEYEDVSYDLISTTKESQHEKHDEQPIYLIKFRDIERVEPLQTPENST